MGSLKFDLLDAVRGLWRDGLYALTILVTLAVTIGATTAVFSIVNGVLLEPLAYRESQRLVALREIWHRPGERGLPMEVNERHFNYWREHAQSFASMATYTARPANLTGAGEAARITVARTSGSLFEVLQVQATIGRTLTQDDEPEERPDVVVVSDGLWRQRFNRDPALVGRAIVIDGKPYTVTGILPADFQIPDRARLTAKVDAFVPLRVNVGWVGDHNNDAIGRLRDGVNVEQARAELDVLQQQVGAIATREAHEPVTLAGAVTPLTDDIVGQSRRGLWLLMAAVASVLLIACANLANLSLSRTFGRLREAAIRSALGASRSRLVTRAVLEHLLLSSIGGALGIWFAWLALAIFVRTAPIDLPRVNEVRLDARVLAFAAAVSVLAAMVVAVLPAWRLASRDVQSGLRATGTAFTGDRTGARSRSMLLIVQVALSVTLLVVTGLLAISFVRVLGVDRGFNAEHVLTVDVSLPAARYADEPVRLAAYDRMIESLRMLPGVQAVTTTSLLPLAGQGQSNFIVAEGDRRPIFEQPNANFRFVAPDYFSTMGITVVRGRSFTGRERDPRRPAPVVISASTAATLWAGQDAIGKRFSRGFPEEQGFEVVGVTPDTRVTSLERTPPLMVYAPYWWRSRPSLSLLIRTAGEPTSILASLRRSIHGIDPDIAIGEARPLEQLVDASVAARRYQMRLFVVFGGVALFIATVGVYAVTAFGVSRRRREMNIRVALGAQASQVRRMNVGQGLWPVLAGVAIGVIGALATGRVLSSLLFEVDARDPIVISAVAATVIAVGVIASTLATRQGLSLDPAAALRED
jgi:putative ABC transport system permease protein